jgi:hypothetical protein
VLITKGEGEKRVTLPFVIVVELLITSVLLLDVSPFGLGLHSALRKEGTKKKEQEWMEFERMRLC